MSDDLFPYRAGLARVLEPRCVAIVGASESSRFARNCLGTLDSDAEVVFVNPKYQTLFERATVKSLADIDRPVDAVFSLMGAERTADLVEEATAVGAGGVISVAGGFAEMGQEGAALQERVTTAARSAGMPVIGPNGVGYIHVPRGLDLTMLSHFSRRVGGLSVVAHSGATLEALAAAAWRPGGVGFAKLISAGNEPVSDLADYLDYLVDDPDTRLIALVIEKIRRPDAFFDAAARARRAGKPIIAIKLARTERSRRMAQSHTGTLTGDSWVYEQAFAQAGILCADEIDELVDRLQFLDQLPPERWSPVRGLFVLAGTGGFTAMAGDLGEAEGVDMPEAPELLPQIADIVPGVTVPNPLDATGFMATNPDMFHRILDVYLGDPHFDAYLFMNQFADWDQGAIATARLFADRVRELGRPSVLSPLAGRPGEWLAPFPEADGVAVGNGLRGTLRGFATMAAYVRQRPDAAVQPAKGVARIECPTAEPVDVAEGRMLPFAASMELLSGAGIPVAPWYVLTNAADVSSVPFPGPYVAKLADVAHRSDHGAVSVGVEAVDLAAEVDRLQRLAVELSAPSAVAVQPLIAGEGEAFVGLRGDSELGPVVAFGLGGVFVEVLHRVAGRIAPLSDADAVELLAELDDLGVLDGLRGRRPWDRAALANVLVAAGGLAAGARSWLDTFDINPLICTVDGPVAVDALCLLRS